MTTPDGDGTTAPEAAPVTRETKWISWLFMIGSACFALASIPMLASVVPEGAIGVTYFVGSVFFMAAAIAAFVLPSTGDALDASIADTGTFLGALCFLWGARLLLVVDDDTAAVPA